MNTHFQERMSVIKKRFPRLIIGIGILALFAAHAGNWIPLPFIERLDGIIYDVRLRATMPGGIDPRVVHCRH